MDTSAAFVHPRYQLHAPLGTGSMGSVYRAHDRLTGQDVALKRVTLGADDADELRLAITHEFRVMASLRHPHIVSVLDYGFDAARQPFFTMELLADAHPILEVGHTLPRAQQIDLLLQALEALAYLHRRGVLHHDLKPENILVAGGHVRLLDFGLAVLADQQRSDDLFGTLLYFAPEVVRGQPYTAQSDLYSLGVVAYELLIGHHPIQATTVRAFLHDLRVTPPDLTALADEPALAQALGRLLAKTPRERPASAQEAISMLHLAAGRVDPPTDAATRESYLQAATFVGREQELDLLKDALAQAQHGHGSAWLIGGESGVGKSRLIHELRTQALVQGAWVWHGQALSESGAPAQLWRGVLSWLALTVPLSDLAASVLKPFVPQLEELLGRTIGNAPALDDKASQDRFCGVVLDSLRQATAQQPLVLVLEDLHWAGPFSRAVLTRVMNALAALRLLIIATYRNDEQPQLPRELPAAHSLILARLGAEQVAHLTSAIVGVPAEQLSALSEFMFQQTEGNTLFVVEILRSLAAEAGLLSQVRELALPAQLLVGGMQAVIQRRLQRVATEDYSRLVLAALVGRDLDLPLLHHLEGAFDWPGWLNRCAEAAVLEPQGAGWRFTHDQVRQGALQELAATQAQALHAQIATGIEQVHAADLTLHLGRLVHHYTQTEQVDKQRWYLAEAARVARAAHDLTGALQYCSQLLPLLATESQGAVYLDRGAMQEALGEWPAAESDYHAALALAGTAAAAQAPAQLALGRLCRLRGDFTQALDWLAQARQTWLLLSDASGLIQVHIETGWSLSYKGEYAQAYEQLSAGLALARVAGDQAHEAMALYNLGLVAYFQGDYVAARALYGESLALFRKLGEKRNIAAALSNLGLVARAQGDFAAVRAILEEGLPLFRELGDKRGVGYTLFILCLVAYSEGSIASAQALAEESLAIFRELGEKRGIAFTLLAQAEVALAQHDYARAQRCYAEGLILSQASDEKLGIISSLAGLAAIKLALGQPHTAAQLAAASETLRAAIKTARELSGREIYEDTVTGARAQLADAAFSAAWAVGEQLTLDAAVQLALQEHG